MDARTVRRWLDEPRFRPQLSGARPSKLDPYKAYIRRLLEHHPYSAAQTLNRLREVGYLGGATIVKDYLQRVRPVPTPCPHSTLSRPHPHRFCNNDSWKRQRYRLRSVPALFRHPRKSVYGILRQIPGVIPRGNVRNNTPE